MGSTCFFLPGSTAMFPTATSSYVHRRIASRGEGMTSAWVVVVRFEFLGILMRLTLLKLLSGAFAFVVCGISVGCGFGNTRNYFGDAAQTTCLPAVQSPGWVAVEGASWAGVHRGVWGS